MAEGPQRPVIVRVEDYLLIQTHATESVTEVRLYDETLDHIAEEHPEIPVYLPSIQTAIVSAIQSPTHIEQSQHVGAFVFVDAGSTDAFGNPLRVPLKPIAGTSALVKTSFFGKPNYTPTIIWRRRA